VSYSFLHIDIKINQENPDILYYPIAQCIAIEISICGIIVFFHKTFVVQ